MCCCCYLSAPRSRPAGLPLSTCTLHHIAIFIAGEHYHNLPVLACHAGFQGSMLLPISRPADRLALMDWDYSRHHSTRYWFVCLFYWLLGSHTCLNHISVTIPYQVREFLLSRNPSCSPPAMLLLGHCLTELPSLWSGIST